MSIESMFMAAAVRVSVVRFAEVIVCELRGILSLDLLASVVAAGMIVLLIVVVAVGLIHSSPGVPAEALSERDLRRLRVFGTGDGFVREVLVEDVVFPDADGEHAGGGVEEPGFAGAFSAVPLPQVDGAVVTHELAFAVVVAVVVHAVVGVSVAEVVDSFAVGLVVPPVAFVDQLAFGAA